MDLMARIQEKLVKIKRNGETPNIIWMGIEEKKEFESYVRDQVRAGFSVTDKRSNKTEFMGLPVEFVSSLEWLSVTTTGDNIHGESDDYVGDLNRKIHVRNK